MVRWTVVLLLLLMVACGNAGPDEATDLPLLDPTAQSPAASTASAPVVTLQAGANLEFGTRGAFGGQFFPSSSPGPVSSGSTSQAPGKTLEPTPTSSNLVPELSDPTGITLGGAPFPVELAVTPDQRTQGLSGRPFLAPGTGMLFIYEQEGMYAFWMIEMNFPLDIVWIDAGCTVAHITKDAPPQAPGQTPGDLPRYVPPKPILYVLEINAGEAESSGIGVGSRAQFTGGLAGRYGC